MGLLDNLDLEDPKTLGLLHAGLSILANNGNGMNGRQAVGTGLLGGLQGMQQAQLMAQRKAQQEQEMQMRQAQQDLQTQQFGMNKTKFDAEMRQQSELDAAIAEQSRLHPELAGAFRIDPKAAIKAAYPTLNANGADPYYTPIATENGLGSFDNRSGKFMPLNINGKPIVKSTDSPALQGKISAFKSYGENLYQPTDMQSGVIKSKSQLAIDAGSPSPSAGFPKIDKGTQRQRDLTALDMKLAEQADGGGVGANPALDKEIANDKMRLGVSNNQPAGIRVPTKAEEAAAIQTAKDDAEYNSPQAKEKRTRAELFKKNTATQMVGDIDNVIGRVDGWTAGIGGNIARKLPFNSEAKDISADIETIKANFGFDRLQQMRDMSPTGGALGQVAVQELQALQSSVANLDPTTQSPQQLKKNLAKAKSHYQNWLNTLNESGGTTQTPNAQPTQKTRSKADILKQYGVR